MGTVLIIDDEGISRRGFVRWLKSAGHEVLEATDGESGLRLAEDSKPDLVISDLLMPGCNGFQVCRSLRSRANGLGTPPIIIVTSSSYPTDRANALDAGADAFLTKPIRQAELLDLAGRLLTRGRGRQKAKSLPAPRTGGWQGKKPDKKTGSTPAKAMDTRIRFWGVRGSIPTPGRETAGYGGNTSCVEMRADGELIVLDAGSGIRPLGLSLVEEYGKKPINLTLLITHTHWDHIQGFPFFVPAYNPSNNLRILGFEGSREGLSQTLSSQMESPYFPISMSEMPGYIAFKELKRMAFSIGAVRVKSMFMNHPGICAGFRLSTSAGSVVFIPDNEAHLRQASIQRPESLTWARSQDRRLIQFIKGADILILDSQYDTKEYQSKVGWGHTCVDDSVDIALRGGVRELVLFHHDPGHGDSRIRSLETHARKLAAQAGSALKVRAAREGSEIVLKARRPATRKP